MLKYSRKIYIQFPPSEPCSCNVCRNYCFRPGWWLVCEAREAIEQGYANRMMLEFSPDLSFGVLSPAFKNNEANFALKTFSKNGCTFFINQKCTLFGKSFQPLECRFCHQTRFGLGEKCHHAIEQDWKTSKGKRLIENWLSINNLQLPPSVKEYLSGAAGLGAVCTTAHNRDKRIVK